MTNIGRRSVLGLALAAPAVALAPVPAVAHPERFDPTSPRFSIAVLPDTQYLFDADRSDPAPLRETFRHVAGRANVAFLTHLGDVTEHGTEDEIRLADRTFEAIDGRVPYSVLAGNHDVRSSTDDQRGDSPYLRAFGPSRFARMPTFRGASPDGYNSAHVLAAGGREWLVLALDWRISDRGLAWAQGVLDANRRLPAILTTHDLAQPADGGAATLSPHGARLWERLIRRNDQIFLTLNGHYWPPARTVLRNDAGNDVHVHITNYQDRYYGGAAMVRLYSFDLARQVIDVETFSPWLLEKDHPTPLEAETVELTGPDDRFSVEVDFDRRFAGFAPVAPIPSRPANAVMPAGTAAYWRFDTAGLTGPVREGVVAKDLSGNGNDLTLRLLHSSAPETVTASTEHHPAQPAHASLRFDGGKAPDRGAILRAGPNAPINTARFTRGYTIEAFVKLPDPFVGDHSWMGVLSWEGRSGRAAGDPDEPTCSLNLSPERFLQFVVYPTDADTSRTSWSHALPVGRWTHVAVVNDGRLTVVYVDGSKIARNPTTPAKGVVSTGKPFVLGATQYADAYDQGFYGWLGDVRICSRPLRPTEFLTSAH